MFYNAGVARLSQHSFQSFALVRSFLRSFVRSFVRSLRGIVPEIIHVLAR